jgi:MOSC domain-containing protein YiiM
MPASLTAEPGPCAAEPSSIDVVSVNVGVPRLLASPRGSDVYSAIAKQPVQPGTALWLSLLNLAGDGQADLSVHGGADKAVYAYPSEHIDAWSAELGEPLGPAPFGENLSTRGVAEADAFIGDVWRWDDAILQISQPRWPCFKLALHRKRADIQARLRRSGRTGWYLRVLSPGAVTIGSPIEIIERDEARLSVAEAHTAMADRRLDNRSVVERLAQHPALASEWRLPLQDRLC